MQSAVVHDGGVGQDPPCKQKRLAFKFASAAWVDANHDVGGGAESKWKEMHPSEQRAMPGADTRAGAAAADWGGHACGSRRSRRSRLACLACPCICAGCCSDCCGRIDRSGRVLHHTSPSRTVAARGLHKASLLHLDVDRSNGCRTRGECWAAAGCVELTERVQLQRPPSICMLMHARAGTKTRGNPDRVTHVPATKSCGLPRWQCVCNAVGAAAQVGMRATDRCKYKIVSDISCDSAHVQQQHDTS